MTTAFWHSHSITSKNLVGKAVHERPRHPNFKNLRECDWTVAEGLMFIHFNLWHLLLATGLVKIKMQKFVQVYIR
jgi:hypothetical protein